MIKDSIVISKIYSSMWVVGCDGSLLYRSTGI